jgi:hypothetical protein
VRSLVSQEYEPHGERVQLGSSGREEYHESVAGYTPVPKLSLASPKETDVVHLIGERL